MYSAVEALRAALNVTLGNLPRNIMRQLAWTARAGIRRFPRARKRIKTLPTSKYIKIVSTHPHPSRTFLLKLDAEARVKSIELKLRVGSASSVLQNASIAEILSTGRRKRRKKR